MLIHRQAIAGICLLGLLPLTFLELRAGPPAAAVIVVGRWLALAACWSGMVLVFWSHLSTVRTLRALADPGFNDPVLPDPGLLKQAGALGALARQIQALADKQRRRQRHLGRNEQLDAVTGLPNRSVVRDRIEMAAARASRRPGTFALLLVDVLKLSDINSRYGHQTGDMVLKVFALRMRGMLRASDTICRLGSDHFLVLIENGTEAQLQVVAEKISAAVNRYVSVQEDDIRVRAACGLVFFGTHGSGWEELLRRAEIAMNTAKERAQRLVVYREGQDELHLREIVLQDDFHAAVRDDAFSLMFQPKMSLAQRDVNQVEALVRWQHAELGLVGPDEFIPLAERTGQIRLLTQWVLEQVSRQQHRWHSQGRFIVVSVNLSPLDLADEQLLSVLDTLSANFDVAPRYLVLEVTESAILEEIATAVQVIEALRERGYQISIDDFGTGYSSLAQIRRLPVRELKIDKSFVMRMQENSEDAVIVHSTIEMAHSLGLKVVAEGVESEEVLEQLRCWGCDDIQGFHLARPMTADDFDIWIASWSGAAATTGGGTDAEQAGSLA